MDFGALFGEIIKQGGVWGALLLLAGGAIVFLFKSHTALYEKMLAERAVEVREMTAALEKGNATMVAMTSTLTEINGAITATKNAMEKMDRSMAVGFETTKLQVQQNKEAIERFERRPAGSARNAG